MTARWFGGIEGDESETEDEQPDPDEPEWTGEPQHPESRRHG